MNTTGSIQLKLPLCQQFGFSEKARLDRVQLMGLDEIDHSLLDTVQREILIPHHQQILTDFYDFVIDVVPMRKFIKNRTVLANLRKTQAEYLLSFGVDCESAEYFEYRLRVGIAHERIGMPLSLYLSAYRYMYQLIVDSIPDSIRLEHKLHQQIIHTIHKTLMLDMSLAIDTYSIAYNRQLTASLDEVTDERDTLTIQLMHDTLTGTFTRQFIMGALEKNLAQLKRQPDRNLVIAMLDLDHFKQINDSYGHLTGDAVLKGFAGIIQKHIRDQDYFGRYGGEEFLLILPDTEPEQAIQLAERLRKNVHEWVFAEGNILLNVSVSIGVTAASPHQDIENIFHQVDKALYRAKDTGRNRVIFI